MIAGPASAHQGAGGQLPPEKREAFIAPEPGPGVGAPGSEAESP